MMFAVSSDVEQLELNAPMANYLRRITSDGDYTREEECQPDRASSL